MRKLLKIFTILLICIVFGGIILLGLMFDVTILDDISEHLPFKDAFSGKRKSRNKSAD